MSDSRCHLIPTLELNPVLVTWRHAAARIESEHFLRFLPVCLSVCLTVLSVCLFVCLSFCLSLPLSFFSLYLSIYLSRIIPFQLSNSTQFNFDTKQKCMVAVLGMGGGRGDQDPSRVEYIELLSSLKSLFTNFPQHFYKGTMDMVPLSHLFSSLGGRKKLPTGPRPCYLGSSHSRRISRILWW